MVNKYKERAREANSEITKSRWQKVGSWIVWPFMVVLAVIGAALIAAGKGCEKASEGCKNASETLDDWSEQSKQKGQEIWDENNQEWRKEVKKEKVDSDSVSIASSEDGEAVDIAY